jgi:hypothetical protein
VVPWAALLVVRISATGTTVKATRDVLALSWRQRLTFRAHGTYRRQGVEQDGALAVRIASD